MTLVELMVGTIIAGLLLHVLVAFFMSQGRLVAENESSRGARSAARTALQVFLTDLRRVEATGGILEATTSAVTVRVPYAQGLVCTSNILETNITLLPSDSLRYANATASGYAWRDAASGDYIYVSPVSVSPGTQSTCTGAGLKIFDDGGVLALTPTAGSAAQVGTPIFLYQAVRYAFVPGPRGLHLVRELPGADPELLVEPFAPGTGFRFFRAGSSAPEDAPPADLGEIRGLQVDLEGLGDRPRHGSGNVATAPLGVSVFFKNRPAG